MPLPPAPQRHDLIRISDRFVCLVPEFFKCGPALGAWLRGEGDWLFNEVRVGHAPGLRRSAATDLVPGAIEGTPFGPGPRWSEAR